MTLTDAYRLLGLEPRPDPTTPRRYSIAELRDHALGLAEKLKIKIVWWGGDGDAMAYARIREREIHTPRITDEIRYAVALHELGHVETPHADKRGTDFIKGNYRHNSAGEMAAWQWAKRNALTWTVAMQGELRRGLTINKAYAVKGVDDAIWEELDRVDGRLPVGHALHLLRQSVPFTIAEARAALDRIAPKVKETTWEQDRHEDRLWAFVHSVLGRQ